MAANVESMFYLAGQPVWHGLGQVIENAPTSKDAIVAAGLDWRVEQCDVLSSVTGQPVPNAKLNYRTSDMKPMGIVTDRYTIVQNEDAFAFLDEMFANIGVEAKYNTAGSLCGGKRVFMNIKLPDEVITGEDYEEYVVITNTHDGSGAVRCVMTPIRTVCQNTMSLALKKATRSWSCKHVGNMNAKLDQALEAIFNISEYQREFVKEVDVLQTTKMSRKEVEKAVCKIIQFDPTAEITDGKERVFRNKQNAFNEIMALYNFKPDLKVLDLNAYRFVNAVSDYATHHKPARLTKNYQENLFINTLDGNDLIDKAYDLVRKLA